MRRGIAVLLTMAAAGCANLSLNPAHYNSTDLEREFKENPAVAGAIVAESLTVRFLGTTSLLFDDGRSQVLIDGFLSRPAAHQVLLTRLRSNSDRIDAVLNQLPNRAERAVFVAHSHYDHALDSAVVARQMEAELYGSPSTLNLGHGEGLSAEQLLPLRVGVEIRVGNFAVIPLRSVHSPTSWYNNNLGREIRRPRGQPVHARRLVEGGSFDFLIRHGNRSMLVRPAAGYEAGALHGVCADILFLAVGTLGNRSESFRKAFYDETVGRVQPLLIVPTHWDSPFRGLDRPMRGTPYVLDNVRRGLRSVVVRARQQEIDVMMLSDQNPIALDGWFAERRGRAPATLNALGACTRAF